MVSAMTVWRHNNPELAKKSRVEYEKKNRDRLNAKRRLSRKANPDKVREEWLRLHYNTTSAWYQITLSAQGYKCAICRRPASEFKRSLAVDHCHTTGKKRGLLCVNCNVLLGRIENSTFSWEDIQAYLASHK